MADGRGRDGDEAVVGDGGSHGPALVAPVLVAREGELAQLAAGIASPPTVAVVEGEPGVGKTRLVTELLAAPAAAGRLALVGHSHPLRDPFPLGPVVEALRGVGGRAARVSDRPLAGALRPVLPELAAYLPPALDPVADPRMERHRLWRSMVELLGAVGPAVLVLEDLHWADEATVEFVSFLAARFPADLALVLTWRTADLPSASPLPGLAARPPAGAGGVHVVLSPFPAPALKALVSAILASDDVSDEFVAYLHERTAGIPFAVEEILRLLQDRRDLVRWQGRWARRTLDRLEVPAAVRESVLERLGRLGPEARRLVQAAAVVGQPAGEALLAAVAGLPADAAAVAVVGALEAAVLQEAAGGRYVLRHALATEAVYGAIPGPARRRLHQRAARHLAGDDELVPASVLARHYKEAGLSGQWVRHAQAAAAQAGALGDHAAATTFLLDALAAPRLSAATRGELALELSVAALHALDHGEAVAAVAGVSGDPSLPAATRGKLAFNLGALLHQSGDASGSRRAIARAVPDLRRVPAMRAVAMSALASPWVVEGDLAEHLGWLDRADALAAAHPDAGVAAILGANRAAVLLAVGDPAAATTAPAAPVGEADWDLHEWVRSCTNLAVNHTYLGRYDHARRWVSEGRTASEARGYDRLSGSLRATELVLRWSTGQWADLADAAAALEEEALDAPAAVQAGIVRGMVDLVVGHLDPAASGLHQAADRAARCGAIPTMGMACAALGRARLSQGDPGAALDVVMAALNAIAAKGIWAWAADVAPVAVHALVALGDVEEAAEWSRRVQTGLEGRHAPAASAGARHCQALLAEASGATDAADRFQLAEEAWRALPRPYEAAFAAEGRGRTLVVRSPDAGAAPLLDALAGFHQLGAARDEARVRQLLRRHQVPLPYPFRGGRRRRDDALSAREREVAELAARGATSGRIAQELFLSPRTVDHHIERALRKLGLASRKELATALDQGGAAHQTDLTTKIG